MSPPVAGAGESSASPVRWCCALRRSICSPLFPDLHFVHHSLDAIGLLRPTAGVAVDDAGYGSAYLYHLLPRLWLQPPATGTQYLNFRIVNRAMVAGMLWLMSQVLMMWYEAEHHRAEQPKHGHNQISLMLGMLIAMPTVIAIALLDGLIPGEFSLAVFVCGSVGCLRVGAQRAATVDNVRVACRCWPSGIYWGPSPIAMTLSNALCKNRILNAVMMLIVTGILGFFRFVSTGKRPTST